MIAAIFNALANSTRLNELGIDATRIFEAESIDTRPVTDGYFIVVSFEEEIDPVNIKLYGPRHITVAVHHSYDLDRDFEPITKILNAIDAALLPIEQVSGSDGIRVSQVRRGTRSGNNVDEGWKTITRTSTFGVSSDETAA